MEYVCGVSVCALCSRDKRERIKWIKQEQKVREIEWERQAKSIRRKKIDGVRSTHNLIYALYLVAEIAVEIDRK